VAEIVACGPDPERHLEMIGRFNDAGFDHLYVHQIDEVALSALAGQSC
jgi:coenzyme F420-dependent glucose-6-phosphate dehydrogenase